jgi:hypothetical protein
VYALRSGHCKLATVSLPRLSESDWTGLDSTLLVCTHCRSGHCKLATESLPRLSESDWTGLDSTLLVCTHPKDIYGVNI